VSATQGVATVAVSDNDVPEVSISAGAGVTEGGAATFILSASPAPQASLTVILTVTQSGSFGASAGPKTVTIPTSGSAALNVATVDDSVDEADGSVTATLSGGSGYRVSATQGVATVAVSDNDNDAETPLSVDTSAVEQMIQEMIVRHRDVTGNAGALANWEKALKTVRGEAGGFTLAELEARVARLRGTPKGRWQRVLDAVQATALLRAVSADDATRVSALLGAGADVDAQSTDGLSALHLVAETGNLAVFDLLIDADADVDAQDAAGWTALHDAVDFDHPGIVDGLIDAGADVDIQDDEGWTALHQAAHVGSSEIVGALLDAGADADIQDDEGRTALDVARQMPESGVVNAAVVALLQEVMVAQH